MVKQKYSGRSTRNSDLFWHWRHQIHTTHIPRKKPIKEHWSLFDDF